MTKWHDGGTQCNLCDKEAMWGGLCADCKELPHPRAESKTWNAAIDAAAKWLSELEECHCKTSEGLHTNDCLVVAQRVMADQMKNALIRKKGGADEPR